MTVIAGTLADLSGATEIIAPSFGARLSSDVRNIIDERPEPVAVVSRTGDRIAFFARRASLEEEQLSRPSLVIGGTRVNPANNSLFRSTYLDQLTLVGISDRQTYSVPIDGRSDIAPVGFSNDGRYFAFTVFMKDRVDLRWVTCDTGEHARLDSRRLNGIAVLPYRGVGTLDSWIGTLGSWVGPRAAIACRLVREGELDAPTIYTPMNPAVRDTREGDPRLPWPVGALNHATDEYTLARLLASEVGIVNVVDGSVQIIGASDLFQQVTASPDGRYLLVERCIPPFNRRAVLTTLRRSVEIWRLDGENTVRYLWQDPEHRAGRRLGARGWRWHPLEPATVAWLEPTESGERVLALKEPFAGTPSQLLETNGRCAMFSWTTAGRSLAWESDRSSGTLRLRVGGLRRTLSTVILEVPAAGERIQLLSPTLQEDDVVVQRGRALYVSGTRTTGGVTTSRCVKIDVETGVQTLVHESPQDKHESVLAILCETGAMLTVLEGTTSPPQYFLLDPQTLDRRELLGNLQPTSFVAQAPRAIVTYRVREDVSGDAIAFLPRYQSFDGPGPPCMIWIHPVFGPVIEDNPAPFNRYFRPNGVSPIPLIAHGYSVVYVPSLQLPANADPERVLADLASGLQSLIDVLVSEGYADRSRVAVGGHCLGAWATAMLLSHCDVFRAGVAVSGYFNLTMFPGAPPTGGLEPWQFPHLFVRLSPLMSADRIRTPILLIHGDEDTVAPHSESERLHAGIAASGGTSRLVTLRHQGHLYEAREARILLLDEMLAWLDTYAKAAVESISTPQKL